MPISRRTFAKRCGQAACFALASRLVRPGIFVAEAAAAVTGPGKYFVHLVGKGGACGQFMFPHGTPSLFSIQRARRPGIMNALSVSDVALPGSPALGMHPNFATTAVAGVSTVKDLVVNTKGRLITCVGLSQLDGSHEAAMSTLMAGLNTWNSSGTATHWVSRWMDTYNFSTTQGWLLGNSPSFPFKRAGEPAIEAVSLSQYAWNDRGTSLGGDQEGKRTDVLARNLLNMQADLPQHGTDLVNALKQTVDMVESIRPYRTQPVRSEYDGGDAGGLFKSAAQIIKYKESQGNTSPVYIQISLPFNFDHHSFLLDYMPGEISFLNKHIGLLVDDIGASAFGRTCVAFSTEFGRAASESGANGADHGWGNNTFILSGGLNGSDPVAGTPVSTDDATNNRYLPVHTESKQIYAEILDWMGHDPTAIFQDFNPRANWLGLFSS